MSEALHRDGESYAVRLAHSSTRAEAAQTSVRLVNLSLTRANNAADGVDFDEFCSLLPGYLRSDGTEARHWFCRLDADGSGRLTQAEAATEPKCVPLTPNLIVEIEPTVTRAQKAPRSAPIRPRGATQPMNLGKWHIPFQRFLAFHLDD